MSSLLQDIGPAAKQQKQYLVSTYILKHWNNSSQNQIFPPDLINLCIKFYEEVFSWKIDPKRLQTFISLNNNEAIYSPILNYNNIKFRIAFIAHGRDQKYNNKKHQNHLSDKFSVQLYMENNMKTARVYFHTFCHQTQRNVKFTEYFQRKTEENIDKSNKILSDVWCVQTMDLFDVRRYKSINFDIYTDILSINYVNNKNNYYKDIKIKNKFKYSWNIDETLLKHFKNCPQGRGFDSNDFDNINKNWTLYCTPNGHDSKTFGSVQIMLGLNRLPYKINAIYIKYFIQINYNNIKYERDEIFSYQAWTYYSEQTDFKTDDLLKLNDLTFTVDIEIKSIQSTDLIIIPRDQWDKYGVID